MDPEINTSVLVVGAGPVGLTLAIDLASRGIATTIVETRRAGEPPNVKCNQVSARSMEIFRRLGLASQIRNTGLPAEYRRLWGHRSFAARASTRSLRDRSALRCVSKHGSAVGSTGLAPEASWAGSCAGISRVPSCDIARQIRTFWALMPQGRLLPLSWMIDPCLRSARPFGLAGPLRTTSALAVTRMTSGLPSA